jgi:hypothetical protein
MPESSRVIAPRSSRKRKQVIYVDDSDEAELIGYEPESTSPRPRKRRPKEVIDLTADEPSPKKKARGGSSNGKDSGKSKPKEEEKRLRRFRSHPPHSYLEIKARALSQRLTVLSRQRAGTDDVPEEKVVMAGSTGNVYTQHVGLVPSCDCPHAKKGNQCKHILYVMLRVLKAPEHIGYQLALTSSELREVFRNAAPIPTDGEQHDDDNDGKRKPIEGECPICYCDFEPEKEAIVYCKAACGNNVHKGCMQSWIASTGVGRATCPYCRAKWEDVDIGGGFSGNVDLDSAKMTRDGYVNVASQLGLSGRRDYSSYHRPWASRQRFDDYEDFDDDGDGVGYGRHY